GADKDVAKELVELAHGISRSGRRSPELPPKDRKHFNIRNKNPTAVGQVSLRRSRDCRLMQRHDPYVFTNCKLPLSRGALDRSLHNLLLDVLPFNPDKITSADDSAIQVSALTSVA